MKRNLLAENSWEDCFNNEILDTEDYWIDYRDTNKVDSNWPEMSYNKLKKKNKNNFIWHYKIFTDADIENKERNF
jgi:hypothetical protein